jgi:hypothetical protein
MDKIYYSKPNLQYWAKEAIDIIEATMSGGGGGGGKASKPTMANCLSKNFKLGDNTDGAVVIIEALWDKINEVYSDLSIEYRNWLFFRALGDFVYGSSSRGGILWSLVAGPFLGLEDFFYKSLEMTPNAIRVIEKAVKAETDSNSIDFAHLCIVVATHLALDLGLCSVYALEKYGLTTDQDILNVAGWGGDAGIASPQVSFPISDSMADMDAVNLANLLQSGYSARSAIQSYYSDVVASSKRIKVFKSLVYSSRTQYIADIIYYQAQFGTSPATILNYNSAEAEYYLQLTFPDVYDNFLSLL